MKAPSDFPVSLYLINKLVHPPSSSPPSLLPHPLPLSLSKSLNVPIFKHTSSQTHSNSSFSLSLYIYTHTNKHSLSLALVRAHTERMACFLGCFGFSKKRKRPKSSNRVFFGDQVRASNLLFYSFIIIFQPKFTFSF